MIFNKSVFKKLLKEAYRGSGLLAANRNGRIILAGNWWVITMHNTVFSNEARAAVVEYAGDLPAPGECWRVTSMGCQTEIPPDYINIDSAGLREYLERDGVFQKSKMIVENKGMMRIYQRKGSTVLVNELAEQLMDIKAAVEGEDTSICGPYYQKDMMYWFTTDCSLAVKRIDPGDGEIADLIKDLSAIQLPYTRR